MSTPKRGRPPTSTNPVRPLAPHQHGPEKKFGPFGSGIAVAIWVNTITTDTGPRKVRSITLSPRRYLDRQSGEWRDSASYWPGDLPALIFALTKAQEYVFTEPLPGEQPAEANDNVTDKTPF
jgi:hypothetical protein